MSFIAFEPSPPSNPPTPAAAIVENDGWYVDIQLSQMRDAERLDGTVTEIRLRQAVIAAILHVNNELRDWKLAQIAAGHVSLAAVPADRIDRESVLIARYRRAVYCWAKADLTERYRDFDSTASSLNDKKTMEALDVLPSDQRRNAHWAIADIIGRSHMTVDLI
ncbi:head completion/stabilization protein [Collimonas silvisoli]|uniref:head completion/stabilization protein n=1 Tax=Collimonas silvisoli TaxID=2825884 RepID=UPI001B8D15AA|nr:head completion/stabilization protein [Collimonas silvisoli]